MIAGLSVANFTVLHVVISMIAIFAGFIVLGAMFSSAKTSFSPMQRRLLS